MKVNKLVILQFIFTLFLNSLAFSTHGAIYQVDIITDNDNLAAYTAGDFTNTLRKCIRLANTNPGKDSIYFNIPGAPYLITAGTPLPAFTGPVLINGLTQGGAAAGTPLIEIDGSGLNVLQVDAGASGSTIQGLILYGANRGIYINGSSNNVIIANHIGTNQTAMGVAPAPLTWNGIEIGGNSTNNIIGGTSGITTRNIISGANEAGIRIQGTSTNTIIAGNYIGTNRIGTAAIPNLQNGIFLLAGSNNTQIGGITPNHANLISGNNRGVLMDAANNCMIQFNLIGSDITGLAPLPNNGRGLEIINNSTNTQILYNVISGNSQTGIFINNNSNRPTIKGNFIGVGIDGTTPMGNQQHGIEIQNVFRPLLGGALLTDRNIICNNMQFGVRIDNGDSAIVKGNYIGVDRSGLLDFGNVQVGILFIQSDNVLFGGALIGEGNIVSGNNQRGVAFENNSNRPVIKGNYIGLASNGSSPIPNNQHGLHIINCFKPIIGGSTLLEKNYISSNLNFGMRIENADSAIVKGNYIGVDISGMVDVGNNQVGALFILSDNVQFGGTTSLEGNIVSGNNERGLVFENNSIRPIIQGNIIGLGSDGTTPVPNNQHGLHIINCFKPILGGSINGAGNIISGNAQYGIRVDNGDSAILRNNKIGVDISGILDVGNAQVGCYFSSSDDVQAGGPSLLDRNIISGNNERGLVFDNSPRPIIKGNCIGLGQDLTTAIGNTQIGLHIINSVQAVVGGSISLERNYVSANGGNGIFLEGSPYSIIKGNYVGVDGSGNVNRGNSGNGILLINCRESLIGGSSNLERNISSGSLTANGIEINGDSKRCIVRGNICGLGADGNTDIGNALNGINVFWTSDTLVIGGPNFMDRNICSANGKSGTGDGIRVEGPDGHTILGNFCGVDSTGTQARGNAWAGISLNESNDNLVGGAGQYEGNICSGNLNEGVWLRNANRNLFYGNFVGTDRTGTLQLGNQDWGFAISPAGPNFDNIIGGSLANANTIAYNLNIDPIRDGQGVYIDDMSQRNMITYNKIYCNVGLGIDRSGNGNENVPAPVVTKSVSTSVNGTGVAGHIVHLYRNATSDAGSACDCEGEIFIGTTAVKSDGTWEIIHNLNLSPNESSRVTATQTNTTNSTSAFSNCTPSCEFTINVNSSDTLINAFDPQPVELNVEVTSAAYNATPFNYYWIMNVPDTSQYVSTDTMYTFTLNKNLHTTTAEGTYRIYMVATRGLCSDSVAINLMAYQIPNLVTPNGDDKNDLWEISDSPLLFDAQIYNRWGQLIHNETGYTNGWDISKFTDGIYYFQLKSKTDALRDYTGWVQIVR